MKRSTRMAVARETVEIVRQGSYRAPSGRLVNISIAVQACLANTRFFPPEELERISQEALLHRAQGFGTVFEVVNETTLQGITRLLSESDAPVAALNFASARNPGGGFLNGSHAQEESLARSSALYASQHRAWAYYERHRASQSLIYSDAMILSPGCPVFRDDEGNLLEEPLTVGFITSSAPNAGATADNRPEELPLIPDTFRRRSELVLALAASQGFSRLVLGAWGCGVFRNDPTTVAEAFAGHLVWGAWAGLFERLVFSVLDTSAPKQTLAAFQRCFQVDPPTIN